MSRPPANEKFKPRFPGDRATAPTPLEDSSDAAWDEFVRLQTEPASLAPASGPARQTDQGPSSDEVSLDSTLLLARQRNRACPMPRAWEQLYSLLPRRGQHAAPQPVQATQWKSVSTMQKRLLLRHQIEWAAATGALDAVHVFLSSLPEEEWEHL